METRIITIDELHHVRTIFQHDNSIERRTLSDEQVEQFIVRLRKGMEENKTFISMTFDGTEPIVMYIGYVFEQIATWWVGLTKTTRTSVHYKTTAKTMAKAFDVLAEHLHNKGYYKVFMTASERNHNIRNKIMCECCEWLPKYDWFDEVVIPKGQNTDSFFYNVHYLHENAETDIVLRLFMLKQEYRIKALKSFGSASYIGTLNNDS